MDKVEISFEIFGCEENERQSSEILNDIAPLLLFHSAVVFIEYLFSKKGQDTKHVLRFCFFFLEECAAYKIWKRGGRV